MSLVAVLKTSPQTVINDYGRLMQLAEYENSLSRKNKTILKLNLPGSLYFPGCSTEPWQLEGVLNTLKKRDYNQVVAVENQTVVAHPWKGAYANKWLPVLNKYGVKFQPLTDVEWVPFEPKTEMLAMHSLFNEILIPKIFFGTNVIHLPIVKTHGYTTTTGAIKNAFGGLIPKYRHHAHLKIHEILVDLLAIQKEIHKGIFAVMDGCVCGNGAGPKNLEPVIGNLILASEDQVAIDAVAAKIMGFDPLKIEYIKMAHDRGLGMGDTDQIEIAGMTKNELKKLNFKFAVKKNPVILGEKFLREKTVNTPWLYRLLFRSPLFKVSIFGSVLYNDWIWYNFVGRKKIKDFMKTDWGVLFEKYECGQPPKYKEVKEWDLY